MTFLHLYLRIPTPFFCSFLFHCFVLPILNLFIFVPHFCSTNFCSTVLFCQFLLCIFVLPIIVSLFLLPWPFCTLVWSSPHHFLYQSYLFCHFFCFTPFWSAKCCSTHFCSATFCFKKPFCTYTCLEESLPPFLPLFLFSLFLFCLFLFCQFLSWFLFCHFLFRFLCYLFLFHLFLFCQFLLCF